MRMTAIAIGGLVLALLAAPAFAQSDDDWVRVPSSRGAASEGGGAAKTTMEEQVRLRAQWWGRSCSKRR